jgi:metallo-beta-lactamase family protein
MRLTFWGAAQQVTGSMFLLETGDYKMLIDCGMDMSRDRRGEDYEPAWTPAYPGALFPFDASTISCVLLTHAHLDHSGQLPNLVRAGFEGQIFCTPATRDLTTILLYDSANLHAKKAKTLGQRKDKAAIAQLNELYYQGHVDETIERFQHVSLDRTFKLQDNIKVTYITAGHLLGAASIHLEITEEGKTKTIGFSGDLGRFNYPLLQDPKPFPAVDYLVTETTYGNRYHKDKGDPTDILAAVIQKTCVDIPGRLLIPAFSVGRTQAILYTLNRLYSERGFTPIKVFSDSPMALLSTKVFNKYIQQLNNEAREFEQVYDQLFDFENFEYVADPEKSKAINDYNEPCIIISSSGMIKGGRIEYHVKRNIENPYATIFIVGFAPEGTLSHSLIQGTETIYNDGKEYKVRAGIERTDIFSGHADLDGLLKFVGQQNKEQLKHIFLVHGDTEPMADFSKTLLDLGYKGVTAPAMGEEFVF